jgi:hypothetical protein
MAHDVFISYSSRDKPTADAVCAALEQQALRCWIAPRDVLPGMEWGEAIVEAIRNAQVMVMVFSSWANESRHVRREVERAIAGGLTILPFRIEAIGLCHALGYFLGNIHWLDALNPPLGKHLKELAEKVSVLLLKRRQTPVAEDTRQPPRGRDKKPETTRPLQELAEVARFCTQCRAPNVTKSKFCTQCGTSLGLAVLICGQCASRNCEARKFCTNCGACLRGGPEDVTEDRDSRRCAKN